MSQFPELETKRLVLRELTQNDSSDIFQCFSLDEVTKFYDVESFTTINKQKN
jgi:ribosomal-protein-alanine N-acetyltransferase